MDSDPAIAGCRKITGYIAVRIFDPAARHPNPLNLRHPTTMPPGTARVRRRSTSELGGRGRAVAHSQHRAKITEIAATTARTAEPDGLWPRKRCVLKY